MEITTYSQCACANCGCIIDYNPSRAGEPVDCPRCNVKSVLPEGSAQLIETIGPPTPNFRTCEICGTTLNFLNPNCHGCLGARSRRRWNIATVFVAAITIAVVIVVPLKLKQAHEKRVRDEAVRESIATVDKKMPFMLIEARRETVATSPNQLVLRRYQLERRANNLRLAVGDLDNPSGQAHLRLRIDFDLLDKAGRKIGSVSDFCTRLGPFQSWHFIAAVPRPDTATVRFAGIGEDTPPEPGKRL